jgi:two-component system copper resistance phosphate regulon response regulator CusR
MRVLLIEDDAAIADFLVRGLREEGFIVTHVPDGLDARHRLETEMWDIVLLDWWLPGVDGLTLLKEYRQRGSSTPVLLLTARDAVSDRVSGLNSGADDYVCKPFAFEELLARIRSLTRRYDRRNGTRLAYDDVMVDLVAHRAERAGKRLDLTVKEQSLLAFLLRNAGKVLTRTRIYEHVWDEQYDGLSNTLEVHIMELRRKLEAHGPRLIFTVRGRGYMLGHEQQAESA